MRLGRCGGRRPVGETQKRPHSALVQQLVEGRHSAIASDLRRRSNSGARAGRGSGPERTHGTTLDRFAGKEHAVASGRPAAAVHIQPTGGLRRCQRRRADGAGAAAGWLRPDLRARGNARGDASGACARTLGSDHCGLLDAAFQWARRAQAIAGQGTRPALHRGLRQRR